jgi:hypothetical protein
MPFEIFVGLIHATYSIPITIFLWNKYLSWANLGGRRWYCTIRIGDSLFGESTDGLQEPGGRGEWYSLAKLKEKMDDAVRRGSFIFSTFHTADTIKATDAAAPRAMPMASGTVPFEKAAQCADAAS